MTASSGGTGRAEMAEMPTTARLADVPEGSTVLVRARVRRYKGHEFNFTDLMIEQPDGYCDSGAGTARLFNHHVIDVEVVDA